VHSSLNPSSPPFPPSPIPPSCFFSIPPFSAFFYSLPLFFPPSPPFVPALFVPLSTFESPPSHPPTARLSPPVVFPFPFPFFPHPPPFPFLFPSLSPRFSVPSWLRFFFFPFTCTVPFPPPHRFSPLWLPFCLLPFLLLVPCPFLLSPSYLPLTSPLPFLSYASHFPPPFLLLVVCVLLSSLLPAKFLFLPTPAMLFFLLSFHPAPARHFARDVPLIPCTNLVPTSPPPLASLSPLSIPIIPLRDYTYFSSFLLNCPFLFQSCRYCM